MLVKDMMVKDMTVGELQDLVRHTIEQALDEFFVDPDRDLEIREEVKQRLLESRRRREAGERGITAEEAAKKLGLHR